MSPSFRTERDIAGNFMMRDQAVLTKRLAASFRREGGQTCFQVETADELSESLDYLRALPPRGRTPGALARNSARRAKLIRDIEEKIPLALQYEAETARIREASGVAKATDLIAQKKAEATLISNKIMGYQATTYAGLVAKADFYSALPLARYIAEGTPTTVVTFGWAIAHDIQRVAEKGGAK